MGEKQEGKCRGRYGTKGKPGDVDGLQIVGHEDRQARYLAFYEERRARYVEVGRRKLNTGPGWGPPNVAL